MTQYSQSTIDKAHAILDGVVAISGREMLIHGTYVTSDVVRPDLAREGAICGGRQACLLGSVALAATDSNDYQEVHALIDAVRFGTDYQQGVLSTQGYVGMFKDERKAL